LLHHVCELEKKRKIENKEPIAIFEGTQHF
jgi:hypothetical protein